VRDFQDKNVSPFIVKSIIYVGLKTPLYDHLRNWEFVVLEDKNDKEEALQFVMESIGAQLDILDRTLVDGTSQKKMYDYAMPRQYSILYNASHVILPFFKATPELMNPSCVSSFNPISSAWCVI